MNLDNITGFKPDGTPILNFAPQSGRVVIVGQEPLLEALPTSNQVVLLQYALPGTTNILQWTTNLPPNADWQSSATVLQTNLVQDTGVVAPTAPSLFFRALRE